ncbi:ATP-binding cassette, sub-family B, member 8 precursor [Ectocarpus siliculosus]|uniref:ATP-binding cassette, sub-family B, member 8 n=1 Tax=Ectocarpus siliculosus TaxID=2880 RepID=D7G5Q1_ECTSI|nr:ATP-binding cassette, sub-family B, member 8 precursor [Ectocarpus siliculosus]|eukprot:CBJ27348.1 ATP-binding cassette, sub-family B, member 8 precursor [Ectocarpus siliculosus]
MGFELSIWRSFGSFRRHVGETFLSSREKAKAPRDAWRYMGTLVRSQRGVLLASIVTLVLAAACEIAVPHYSSRALNAAAFANDRVEFARSLQGMVAYSLLASVFTGLRGACFWLAGTHVVAKVRFDLLSSLLKQDISFHDSNETGALTSRLASDTAKISNVVSFHVNILCRQVIQAVGGLGYLYMLERQLACVALVGLVLVGGITTAYGRFSRRISAKVQTALAEAGSVAEQSLSLIRVVRAHANEQHERRRYGGKIGNSVELQETQGIAYGVARVVIGWSQAILLGAVLLLGAGRVFDGRMTGQQLTTFVFYTQFVTSASFDVGDQIQEALGAGQKVFELLDREPIMTGQAKTEGKQSVEHSSSSTLTQHDSTVMEEHAPPLTNSVGSKGGGDADMPSPHLQQQQQATSAHAGSERQRQRGRVEFDSVSFGYPTRSGVLVLDGLNLTVRPGEKVAVVGSSGGGKSTILRLICRFYDPQGGSILLGGRDLSTYKPADISNVVSWVTQEPQLFPISVRENIAYGMGSYSMEDVYKAAKSANIHNFVSELPEGYDTLVGEGGASLSGGQKQRVAIARALIRDPEVLLLDEPTSALDVESERLVQDALDTAGKGRTVILIAHRLATIQRADRIVVMQNGRLVESGKHEELLSLGGVYAGLYKQGEQVATLK